MHSDNAILRWVKKIKNTEHDNQALQLLKELLQEAEAHLPSPTADRRMLQKPNGTWDLVAVNDICFANGCGSSSDICVWRNGKKEWFYFGASIGKLHNELLRYGFMRVHESHLINPLHIAANKFETNMLLLSSGDLIAVSHPNRRRVAQLFPPLKAPPRVVVLLAFIGQICQMSAMVCEWS